MITDIERWVKESAKLRRLTLDTGGIEKLGQSQATKLDDCSYPSADIVQPAEFTGRIGPTSLIHQPN